MQGCVIPYGTVVFFQKSRNVSQSLLINNNFYCAIEDDFIRKAAVLLALKNRCDG